MMARSSVTNHWFASFEAPREWRLAFPKKPARQTKSFPTETEAKQFVKEMLSNKYRIVAGALISQHVVISGSQLYRWIEEEQRNDFVARGLSSTQGRYS